MIEKKLKKDLYQQNSYQNEELIASHDTYTCYNVIPFVPKSRLSPKKRDVSAKTAEKSWFDSIRIGRIFLFDSMEGSNPQKNDSN